MATSANPIIVWARNRLVPVFAPLMMRTAARRRLAFRFISQLGIRYTGSSLVGDCGERAPDAMVDGGKHLVDAYKEPRHHLVVFGDGAEFLRAATTRYAPELDGLVVVDATARERYGVSGDGWVLVRPINTSRRARSRTTTRRSTPTSAPSRDELVEAIDVMLRRRRQDGVGRRVAVGHEAQVDAGGMRGLGIDEGVADVERLCARSADLAAQDVDDQRIGLARADVVFAEHRDELVGEAELADDGARQLARLVGRDRLVAADRA